MRPPPENILVSAYAGAKIRQEMTDRSVSQKEVAALTGLSQSVLARKLSGRVSMSLRQITSICRAVGIPAEQALDGAPLIDAWADAPIDTIYGLVSDCIADAAEMTRHLTTDDGGTRE